MTYKLLHHTGCSTSRNGLALLQEYGVEPEIRKYMNAGEALSVDELKDIARKMGASSPREFLRDKDAKKFEIPDDLSDEATEEVSGGMAGHGLGSINKDDHV